MAFSEAEVRADGTGDGDQAAPHLGADFVVGVAVDENRPACHASLGAGRRGADVRAGVALHADRPAAYLAAEPVAGIAFNDDSAAAHGEAGATTNGAVDDD